MRAGVTHRTQLAFGFNGDIVCIDLEAGGIVTKLSTIRQVEDQFILPFWNDNAASVRALFEGELGAGRRTGDDGVLSALLISTGKV